MVGFSPQGIQAEFVERSVPDDGSLRKASLQELIQSNVSNPGTRSPAENNINAIVVGLHLVQNDRTMEQIIVGGGDDGSIAFWELRSVAKPHTQCLMIKKIPP